MNLTQILRVFWIWRWLILISAFSSMGGGAWVALKRAKTYTAETRVLLDAFKPDLLTGATLSSSFEDAFLPSQIELIHDDRVTGRVVDRLGWAKSQSAGGQAHADDLRRALAREIADNINVYSPEGSNMVAIGYTAADPAEAAMMVNAVRDAYVEEAVASQRLASLRSAARLDRQLSGIQDRLRAAERASTAYEQANGVVLLDNGQDASSAHLAALTGAVPMPMAVPSGSGSAANPELSAQLAAIDAKIGALSASLGSNHPQLQALRQQRAALAIAARASVARPIVVGGGGGSIAAARDKVLSEGEKVATANNLRSEVKVLSEQYAAVAARAADFRQQAQSDDAGITPLGNAIPPRRADPPEGRFIVAADFVLGLLLGLLMALLAEFLLPRVRSAEDLRRLDVPLLGPILPNKRPI